MNDFLKERMSGLGGSDIPVILGVSPFGRTALDVWREKLGHAEMREDTAPMKRGRALEPIAAKEYAAATGRKLATGATFFRHPERPYLIGHLDAQIMTEDRWDGVLEIKVPNLQTYLKYKREGLADYIQLQLQAYLAVTGKPWGSMWCWSPELWEGIQVDIERDEDIINLIYDKSAAFWQLVETRTPPEPDVPPSDLNLPKPAGAIAHFDGDSAGAEWKRAVRDLRMAQELRAESDAIYEAAKSRVSGILEALGATCGEGHGCRVYWSESKGRGSFDKDQALADLIACRELLKAMRPNMPVNALESLPGLLERIDAQIAKPCTEKAYTRLGKPFKTFRCYHLNPQQLEM